MKTPYAWKQLGIKCDESENVHILSFGISFIHQIPVSSYQFQGTNLRYQEVQGSLVLGHLKQTWVQGREIFKWAIEYLLPGDCLAPEVWVGDDTGNAQGHEKQTNM